MSKKLLPIPLVLLIPIVLLVVVIVAAVYRFSLTDEEIYAKQGVTVKSEQTGETDQVMLKLFALKDAQPWLVSVPESLSKAQLTQVVGDPENARAKGFYSVDGQRGEVILNFLEITPLNYGEPSEAMTFVAPYVVTTQGTGVFHYLGLFRLVYDKKVVEQLDYTFIADRAQNVDVATDEPFDVSESVVVRYLAHSASQPLSETPSDQIEKLIKVKPTRFIK
ncbi:hypothetical protein [Vibrio penaeicida]|uniref:Uncharacterized protein n=1 Tax=Vibrio penaeicida TaxID=104609 RepID=A0AAV5P3T0_9VIBR|nr:hypothetical protein [Vibrio penaeicida]RTZ21802.1 hypothetical protein EKN09_17380 [Vibrio penaeicida]GLQ76292.1 hypothetical protein GCM10007932_56550 [Vibrio penaeicida]